MTERKVGSKLSLIRCFAIVPSDRSFAPILRALSSASNRARVRLISSAEIISKETVSSTVESVYFDLARADLALADLSKPSPNNFYEIGLAQSMGKPIIIIIDTRTKRIPLSYIDPRRNLLVPYTNTRRGLLQLEGRLKRLFVEFRLSPRRFRSLATFPTKAVQPPYLVDLEKLNPREFENLCFELLTQMGFRRVEWGVTSREIDVVATLPKKDPDGYEYQELWLISLGRRAPKEMVLNMASEEPGYLIERIFRLREPDKGTPIKMKPESPITLLFVSQKDEESEFFEELLFRYEKRWKERWARARLRIRLWGSRYLTSMIQQYPQLAYKYFSEEARTTAKYRKTPEELYEENVGLTERLQVTLASLEEEKKRRFIAERDAAWKDVAFKAAHKLGNPIDAVDTFLPSLKKRILENKNDEALKMLSDIAISVEEAKKVIEQFKSLTKSQEISTRPTDIRPLVEHACKVACENGVKTEIEVAENCPSVIIDPDRVSEVFNELVANSLHWFDKKDRRLKITVSEVSRKKLPEVLDRKLDYVMIRFEDNGCGVPVENKERIFAPFFTTYVHGTGLGLSLVKRVIDAHGGLIVENGKSGEGASFEMYFLAVKERSR